jgi:hypothetical protein
MQANTWYQRLYSKLTTGGMSARDAEAMVKGTSKHHRGTTKPLRRKVEARKKKARIVAKASRHINRRK